MLLLYVLLRVYLCMKNLNCKLQPNPLHLLVLHDSLNPRNIILKMCTGRGRGNSNKPVCPFGLHSRSSTRLLNKQEISQIRIPMFSKYYLNYRDIQRKFPMVPSPFQRCCVRCKRCSSRGWHSFTSFRVLLAWFWLRHLRVTCSTLRLWQFNGTQRTGDRNANGGKLLHIFFCLV